MDKSLQAFQADDKEDKVTNLAIRHLTVSVHGDLIDLSTGHSIDYLPISSDDFVQKVSCAYGAATSDFSNEIFINIFAKQMEWKGIIQPSDATELATHKTLDAYIWNDLIFDNTATARARFSCYINWLKASTLFVLSMCAIPLLCALKLLFTPASTARVKNHIAIIRSPASYDKIKRVAEEMDITLLSEGLVYKNKNIESALGFVKLGQFVGGLPTLIYESVADFNRVRRELRAHFGSVCSSRIMIYYAPRIVLKCCFEKILDIVLSSGSAFSLVTGNKEDRFAAVEGRMAKRYGIKLICIPHGLEYAYRFPSGLAGDMFYCTSESSFSALKEIYNDKHFLYDERLARKIYCNQTNSSNSTNSSGKTKLVFFTEPRDIHVNRTIIEELVKSHMPFLIKLHPNDTAANYADYDVSYEDDLQIALDYAVCLARKSTVLLNVAYRGNTAVSVLIDSKDRFYANYIFPSLGHKEILKLSSINEFRNYLKGSNRYV